MLFENLRTVKQISEANPAFSEASLRWMIFNAAKNGFDRVIVRLGRRVFIDIEAFDRWIEYSKPKPNLLPVRSPGENRLNLRD